MKYTITENTQKLTEKCEKGMECLTGNGDCLCEVERCIEGKVCFIKAGNDKMNTCNYMNSFGYSYICTCPTRVEIYNSFHT